MTRGFFGIGVYHGKHAVNVGVLYRSAYVFGASFVFTVGQRYVRQVSDTVDTIGQLPLYEYATVDQLIAGLPRNADLVAVEMGGKPVDEFSHPRRAVYLLGAEDHGIPESLLKQCRHHISVPTVEEPSLNVAIAGSIVLYDRHARIKSRRFAA
jgi:tRNA G18 (ribose-2'-O)-methylase SpoU